MEYSGKFVYEYFDGTKHTSSACIVGYRGIYFLIGWCFVVPKSAKFVTIKGEFIINCQETNVVKCGRF
jgi:hypothetical protein